MKKILFVTTNMLRGGTQRVMSLLTGECCENGTQIHIAMLLGADIGYELHPDAVIYDLKASGNTAKKTLFWIRRLRALIRQVKPDRVVAFTGRVNLITLIAACGLGIPVLISERNDPAHDRRGKAEVALCRVLYPKAEKIVFQTAYQRDFYGAGCAKNGVVIANPISAEPYTGIHEKDIVVACGKLMDQKNHPMLIRAFAKIADEFPEKIVHIYGEGARREALQALIDELHMTDRITLCGNTDRMHEVMREDRWFVMCSDYEGMSNALIEAMLSGMVCVTTAWNGASEIITDGLDGYLVPVNDPDALAEKLRTVFRADNSAITENGIRTGLRYRTETIMPKWMEVING